MGCSSSKAEQGTPSNIADFADDFFDHYRFNAKIGQGAFAQVRLVEPADMCACKAVPGETQEKCAKIIDIRDKRQPGKACLGLQSLAAMEVEIWKKVGHHPNVTEFHGAYTHSHLCFVVMERCHCSLYNYMGQMPELNERSLSKLVYQMVSALHHLHACSVIHRDVKPDNFLVGGMGLSTVKICDFGLAAILPSGGKLCGVVGTTPYMCPEMFLGEWYDEGADIWSLAVTVYVFLFGTFPYVSKDSTKEGMVKAIVKGRPPKFESVSQRNTLYSPSVMSFVTKLLQRDPADRPSAEEALKFPYIACAMVSRHKTSALALPSLRPMLETARKAGAITPYDLSRRTEIDDLLSIVQFKQLGLRMPDAWKSSQVSNNEKDLSKQDTSANLTTISEISSCSTDAPDVTPDSSFDSSPKSRYLSL